MFVIYFLKDMFGWICVGLLGLYIALAIFQFTTGFIKGLKENHDNGRI